MSESRRKPAPASPYNGFLDRLQKDAHRSEMDPTNTHPVYFALLAALQLPVSWFASRWLDVPLLPEVGLLAIGCHLAGFAVSQAIRSCFMFDLTGEVTFTLCMVFSYLSIPEDPSPRQRLCTGLSLLWCFRLGWFLFLRILRRGADWRFDKLITEPAYNGFAWVSQGTWIWLQGMCLWQLNHASQVAAARPLCWLDALGVCIWSLGLAIEVVADQQKTAWNANIPSDGQTTWIRTGLWRYSRHPNFFGENLLWLGMAVTTMSGLAASDSGLLAGLEVQIPGGHAVGLQGILLALVSPAWSCFFLVFTSLMLLEKRMDAKFEGNAEYAAFKRRTSVLVPWWPKSPLKED